MEEPSQKQAKTLRRDARAAKKEKEAAANNVVVFVDYLNEVEYVGDDEIITENNPKFKNLNEDEKPKINMKNGSSSSFVKRGDDDTDSLADRLFALQQSRSAPIRQIARGLIKSRKAKSLGKANTDFRIRFALKHLTELHTREERDEWLRSNGLVPQPGGHFKSMAPDEINKRADFIRAKKTDRIRQKMLIEALPEMAKITVAEHEPNRLSFTAMLREIKRSKKHTLSKLAYTSARQWAAHLIKPDYNIFLNKQLGSEEKKRNAQTLKDARKEAAIESSEPNRMRNDAIAAQACQYVQKRKAPVSEVIFTVKMYNNATNNVPTHAHHANLTMAERLASMRDEGRGTLKTTKPDLENPGPMQRAQTTRAYDTSYVEYTTPSYVRALLLREILAHGPGTTTMEELRVNGEEEFIVGHIFNAADKNILLDRVIHHHAWQEFRDIEPQAAWMVQHQILFGYQMPPLPMFGDTTPIVSSSNSEDNSLCSSQGIPPDHTQYGQVDQRIGTSPPALPPWHPVIQPTPYIMAPLWMDYTPSHAQQVHADLQMHLDYLSHHVFTGRGDLLSSGIEPNPGPPKNEYRPRKARAPGAVEKAAEEVREKTIEIQALNDVIKEIKEEKSEDAPTVVPSKKIKNNIIVNTFDREHYAWVSNGHDPCEVVNDAKLHPIIRAVLNDIRTTSSQTIGVSPLLLIEAALHDAERNVARVGETASGVKELFNVYQQMAAERQLTKLCSTFLKSLCRTTTLACDLARNSSYYLWQCEVIPSYEGTDRIEDLTNYQQKEPALGNPSFARISLSRISFANLALGVASRGHVTDTLITGGKFDMMSAKANRVIPQRYSRADLHSNITASMLRLCSDRSININVEEASRRDMSRAYYTAMACQSASKLGMLGEM